MKKQKKKRKVKSRKEIDFAVFRRLIEKNKEPLKIPDLRIPDCTDYQDFNKIIC